MVIPLHGILTYIKCIIVNTCLIPLSGILTYIKCIISFWWLDVSLWFQSSGVFLCLCAFSAWLAWLPLVLIGLSALGFSLWVLGSCFSCLEFHSSFCPIAVAVSLVGLLLDTLGVRLFSLSSLVFHLCCFVFQDICLSCFFAVLGWNLVLFLVPLITIVRFFTVIIFQRFAVLVSKGACSLSDHPCI